MKLIDGDRLYFELSQKWKEARDFADGRDKEVQIYEDYYSGYADGMERATLKTLTAPIEAYGPKWTKPKEELPPLNKLVLFKTEQNEIVLGMLRPSFKAGEIVFYSYESGWQYFIDDVQYWLLIPELPKEGDDESDKGPLTDRRRGEESMRLIDADALWEEMEKLQNLDGKFANSFTNSAGHRSIEFDRLRDYIDNAPTISEGERGSDGDKQDDQRRTGVHSGAAEVSAAEAEEADRQRRAEQLRQRAILWGRRCDPGRSSSGSSERDDRTDAGQS